MAIFTGPRVESVGFVFATVAAIVLLRGGHRIGVLVCLLIYLNDVFYPELFNWLKNFAEPSTWPGFVALGIAAIFAAHAGGWPGVAVVAGLFITGDGRLFGILY